LVGADLVFHGNVNVNVQKWVVSYPVDFQHYCLKLLVKVLHGLVNSGRVFNSYFDNEWGEKIVNETMWFIAEVMGIPGISYAWFEKLEMTDEVRVTLLGGVSP
jgi:hypothetical protein